MFRLYEKNDYSHDPEGPISIGMKLLKRLEKDGWKGGDIYYAIEDIIVDSDISHPKQMAMRLERELTNYDMWEAPYKGLVNKIKKWQYVNESSCSMKSRSSYRKSKPVNEIAPVVAAVGSQVAKQVVAQAATQAAGQVAQQVANQAAGQAQQQTAQTQESTDRLGGRYSKRKFGYHGLTRRGGRRVNEIAPVVAAVGSQVVGQVANQVAGQVANQVAGQVSQAVSNVTDSDHEFGTSRRIKRFNKHRHEIKRTNESFYHDYESDDEVYMIAYANRNFDIDDIKRFIDMNEIIYEDDYQIEFYTNFPDDVQGELDAHGIEWDIDMNY